MEIIQIPQIAEGQNLLVVLVWMLVGGACCIALSAALMKRKYRYRRPAPLDHYQKAPSADSRFKLSDVNLAQPPLLNSTKTNGSLNSDYVEQLRHVIGASFRKKRVMNKSEFRVFRIIEEEIQIARGGYRVLSQTCLGEILDSDDKVAFASINAKRVDVLVIQPNGEPLAVFEYQGAGHHQNMAAARDAVKKEALRKAGVHYLEVNPQHEPDEIRQMVRKIISIRSKQSYSAAALTPLR